MSFEAMDAITAAEREAKKVIAEAEAKARQMIADAESAGKAALTAANEKAERELAELKKQADGKAISDANALSGDTENKKAALRAKAEARIDQAAKLVVERIVNS